MGSTILLADDSITIQKVVELTFGETEHRVVALSSGRELLRRLPDVRPDVILCDVVMPDLNGYEVCQTLKADPATLHIPLVLLTGTFEPFDRDRALAAGCDAIVTKPFEGRELVNVVEDLLRRARAPQVAEPEPSFFPGLGVPEDVPGIEFTTTGFDQMVPEAPVEPQVPEHGIEMTGVSARAPEPAPGAEAGFEFGGPTAPTPAAEAEQAAGADDSWVNRIEAETPEVGSMQGDFFEQPVAAPQPTEGPAPEPAATVAEGDSPALLQPWEESAELQARSIDAPFEAHAEPASPEQPSRPGPETLAGGDGVLAAPEGAQAFADFGPPPAWEETEAREEPVIGTWPAEPAPPATPQLLQPLNPARESIAAAWDATAEPQAATELTGQPQPSPEDEATEPRPEPGFELDAGVSAAAAPEQAPAAEVQPPAVEEPQEAPVEPVAELAAEPEEALAEPAPEPVAAPPGSVAPEAAGEQPPLAVAPEPTPQPELPATWAVPAEAVIAEPSAEERLPGAEPLAVQPAPEFEPLEAEVEPESEAAPVPGPAPEAIPEPAPAEAEVEPVPESVPAIEATPPVEEGVAAPHAPGEAPEPAAPPAVAVATPVSDELIELVADRVLARIPQPSFVELTDEQITAVAERAVLLIPPPPPPDIPPLSYELEEGDIQRVAARVMEVLPPPPSPKLAEEEVEYVAQRALELLPAPAPQPVELSDSEIDRVTGHVLLALPEPAPPVLPESEIARVLERVKTMLPAAAPAPTAAPGELSEAAVEQVAQRVLQLATPIIERIAWEVLPDMAEMLVRRRIEELEREAEQ